MNINNKEYILLIYDITDNKRRSKFVKFLNSFGVRVQKSAFEAIVNKINYNKIVRSIPDYINNEEDSVRIYRIYSIEKVISYGVSTNIENEELIIF